MTPKFVFLDQNHWIYLARSLWDKAHQPSHKSIPEELISHVDQDLIRLPLDSIHLIEHLRDEKPDRRKRLTLVMERFSRGWFFASWTDVLPVELSRAVAQTYESERVPPSPDVFGKGFLFGVSANIRDSFLRNWNVEDLAKFEWLSAQSGALYDLLTFSNELNRQRQKSRITELSRQNAAASEKLRDIRQADAQDMHRRAQYAGYTYEHQDKIQTALRSIGKTIDDFIALELDGLIQFWSRVPSLDVDCELNLYRDRQWSRKVQINDVRDIGHLVLAVPYCDIVVVERFWARALQETGLAEKYGVTVCTDIAELPLLLGN